MASPNIDLGKYFWGVSSTIARSPQAAMLRLISKDHRRTWDIGGDAYGDSDEFDIARIDSWIFSQSSWRSWSLITVGHFVPGRVDYASFVICMAFAHWTLLKLECGSLGRYCSRRIAWLVPKYAPVREGDIGARCSMSSWKTFKNWYHGGCTWPSCPNSLTFDTKWKLLLLNPATSRQSASLVVLH